jgi:hypothetical protein
MHPDVAYFSILLCLINARRSITRQLVESAATQIGLMCKTLGFK